MPSSYYIVNKRLIMSLVQFDRTRTLAYATGAQAQNNVIYFTTDTNNVVVNGNLYGDVRKVLSTDSVNIQHVVTPDGQPDEFYATFNFTQDYIEPGYYYCYADANGLPWMMIVTKKKRSGASGVETVIVQEVRLSHEFEEFGIDPEKDYLIRTGVMTEDGVLWSTPTIKIGSCVVYWE